MKVQPDDRPLAGKLLEFFSDFEANYLQENANDLESAMGAFKQERMYPTALKVSIISKETRKIY